MYSEIKVFVQFWEVHTANGRSAHWNLVRGVEYKYAHESDLDLLVAFYVTNVYNY